jgi:hypothetical protein
VGDRGWGYPGWLYAAEDIGDTPKKAPRKCRTGMGEDRAVMGVAASQVSRTRLDYVRFYNECCREETVAKKGAMKRSRGLVSVKSGLRSIRSLGDCRNRANSSVRFDRPADAELQFLNRFPAQSMLALCRANVDGGHMIGIEHGKRIHLVLRAAGCLTALTLLNIPLPEFWSSVAWGQQSPTQLNSPVQAQAEPRRHVAPRPAPAAQPPFSPSTPVALPVTNPASALGNALISCDKASEGFEPVSWPGVRGEIKLDRCYRGRDHLVCSFNALLSEAKLLLENYRKIADANYPELGSVDDVCKKTPDNLATDLQNATEFTDRFKELKVEYDARSTCANRIQRWVQDITLPDMTHAPEIVKSMIDAIEGDIKGVSAAQAQLVEFAGRMNTSQKAIITIQKIHRAMCARNQSVRVEAGEGGIPTPLERTGPMMSR